MVAPQLWLLADSRAPDRRARPLGGPRGRRDPGLIRTPEDVAGFLAARVPTTGLLTAAASAAACALGDPAVHVPVDWEPWDAAVSARTPVAALREVSRAQGRALLRTARTAWPSPGYDALGRRPHQALALGVVVAAAGGTPHDAAALAVHHLAGQVVSAAVRLLGMDPLALAAVHARALADGAATIAEAAAAGSAAAAARDPALLPLRAPHCPRCSRSCTPRGDGALFSS